MNKTPNLKDLRIFGLTLALVFALWTLIYQGVSHGIWFRFTPVYIISIGLIFTALACPYCLQPLQKGFMKLAHVINTAISISIMSLLFIFLITPVAIILRAIGYDTLRKQKTLPGSSRIQSKAITRADMEHPF